MALTNAEKQARWRERHIMKRRDAQRIVNLLVRKHLTGAHIKEVAVLLNLFFNREGVRTLRRELRRLREARPSDPPRPPDQALLAEVEAMQDEQEAWERDHPGEEYPEYECGLSGREYTDLSRWRRQRVHKQLKDHPDAA
jgi:hypothetical protein